MSSAVIGALRVVFGADTAAFERGVTAAERKAASFQKSMGNLSRKLTGMGQSLSIGVTAPLAVFGKTAFDAAIQSREAFAQVEAALASMGDASGKTAEELQKSAKQLETFSNFDDDDILQKVTANLLTFGNVAGEQFDRAQQAAVDLSARLGQDLQSSTIMLGKALNDPIAGITAMTRVGVSFTEEQKEMIKAMAEAGDVAGAQDLILQELEKQYGGAAKAAREAAPGGDQLQAWRTLQETIGERLVVAFEAIEKAVTPIINAFLELDEGTQTTIIVVAALAAAIGPALIVIGAMASGLGALAALGAPLAAAFGVIKVAALGLMANPVILGFAAVIAGIVLAWQNWDKIQPILDSVGEAVTRWYTDNVKPIIDFALDKVTFFADFFRDYFAAQIKNAVNLISSIMRGDFRGAWDAAVSIFQTAVSGLMRIADEFFPGLVQMGRDIIQGLVEGIKAAPGAVYNALMNVVGSSVERVKEFLGINSPSLLFMGFGRNITEGLAIGIGQQLPMLDRAIGDLADTAENQGEKIEQTFEQMSQNVIGSLQGLANGIRSGGFLDILSGVLGVFTQLGGAGVFGQGIASTIAGARANGGPVGGGQTYLVGERGPELFTPSGHGRIIANDNIGGMGGAMNISVEASPYFDVRVDGRVVQAAPAIANAGAMQAQAMGARSARRTVRR